MIGIIGGTGVDAGKLIGNLVEREIGTDFGTATFLTNSKIAFLPRHGTGSNIPPHMINHRANISGFSTLGVDRIIGIGSVGSLKKEIRPSSIVVPHDYVNLSEIQTFYDNEIKHITPSLDEGLRREIITEAKKRKIRVLDGGVYVQTRGPRLETRAEVSMLKNFADVVGMTMASEATLAKELGMKYASVCSVDNYAHGLTKEGLDFGKVKAKAGKNAEIILQLVLGALE